MLITECLEDSLLQSQCNISAKEKTDYLNALMDIGFDRIDCGSIFNTKEICQILNHLNKSKSATKISCRVKNVNEAYRMLLEKKISCLNFIFPYKDKEELQVYFEEIKRINSLVKKENKDFILYISNAFRDYENEDLIHWIERFNQIGIEKITFLDTLGYAKPQNIEILFSKVLNLFSKIEFGVRFYYNSQDSSLKIIAAYNSGCRSFESAIIGIDNQQNNNEKMLINISTAQLINFIQTKRIPNHLNLLNFESAWNEAKRIFKF